ncbi:MAG: 4-hydroxy-3-methylbut-2-enyl diphosphate reductase [Tepidiformaceae bacterium]
MKMLVASPRGFCAGVNMAIAALDRALELYPLPIYVFHEIVHNKHVVEGFRARGVIFVDEVEEVTEGGTLVYSAHGVSPQVRERARARRLNVVDATCPLVTKVHSEAIRFARQGHEMVLIGHAGHDEVIGTIGEAPGRIRLVQDVDDVDALELAETPSLAYLSQTTLSVDDAGAIIGRLRERFPAIVAPPSADICYASQNRQEAVRELASEVDAFFVIGSQNSSNSRRLAEIAQEQGVPAYLIDDTSDIDPAWLSGVRAIGVTAGASAPEGLVEECLDYFQTRFGGVIEGRELRTEDMHFQLPVELRRAAQETGSSAAGA